MTAQLSKLTRIINLREFWPHEARDFSPWLSEEGNLKALGDEIGIDYSPQRARIIRGRF
jgi:hypothetical protein